MKVLIMGNMGYVGPIVVRHLKKTIRDVVISGNDSGFFAHCLTGAERLPETEVSAQHFIDVRDVTEELLEGNDAVIHLAAISNDPMGNKFERLTDAINFQAGVRIARMAADCGVRNFVFASSCSIYGASEEGRRRENDPLNPLTAYARSKVAMEGELAKLANSGMTTTALRFATACGASDRIRLDLVLNDFVACAVANNEITVLSDGTPWRPLIDVHDMARAIEWAVQRGPDQGGAHLAVNVGSRDWNYQVRDLADAVARAIPGTRVSINRNALPDKRSYRVDFSLYEKLAPHHQPQMTLDRSIDDIRERLVRCEIDRDFRESHFIRLKVLEAHIAAGRLTPDLRWA